MTRLTKTIKDQIIDNAVAKSDLAKQLNEIKEEIKALVNEIRLDAIGGAEAEKKMIGLERRTNRSIDKLDHSSNLRSGYPLFHYNTYIYVNNNGLNTKHVFNKSLISPFQIHLKPESKLSKQLFKLTSDSDKTKTKIEDLKIEIRAILNQFTTVKKLVDFWGEAEKLLPAEENRQSKELTVDLKNINKTIGIS